MLTAPTYLNDFGSTHRHELHQYHSQTGGMFRALTIRSMSAAFTREPCQWYGSKATLAALSMSVMIFVSSSSATLVALTGFSYVGSIHRHQLQQ